MGKYDDAAKQAADETDKELLSKLKSLTGISEEKLAGLVPESDRAAVKDLIAAVNQATDDNKLSNALANFTAKATEFGIKAVRKLVLGI